MSIENNNTTIEDLNWFRSLNIRVFRLITHNVRSTKNEERMIDKRNTRMYALFRLFHERVQLVGVADNPIVVVDNTFGIPTYVKNFDMYLTKSWDKNSPTIATFKLTEELCLGYDSKTEELEKSMKLQDKFPIYTLMDNKGYYFTGYSKDPEGITEPVYSTTKPRIYISENKVAEAKEQLNKSGFKDFIILKGGKVWQP